MANVISSYLKQVKVVMARRFMLRNEKIYVVNIKDKAVCTMSHVVQKMRQSSINGVKKFKLETYQSPGLSIVIISGPFTSANQMVFYSNWQRTDQDSIVTKTWHI